MSRQDEFLRRHGLSIPIIQAPMAGSGGSALAAAVSGVGGLGSLPCAMLSPDQIAEEIAAIRAATTNPFNVNFFAHENPDPADSDPNGEAQARWRTLLRPYYEEMGLDPETVSNAPGRRPFDAEACALMEAVRPHVISFHFGLPDPALLDRLRAVGIAIWGCATTVAEARWLAERLNGSGLDAIIAQGYEAGGHRGVFLGDDPVTAAARQPGTLALVPQIVDAVGDIPVIAAGGIADGRGILAAEVLGASAVQIGTAYLRTPEALTSAVHREALVHATDDGTALTNMLSGRPARGLINRLMDERGPINPDAPAFPTAGAALAPLKAKAEAMGMSDFSSIWAGQAAALAVEAPAAEVTRRLWDAAVMLRAGFAT
jgi:nitronate monooxygenase